MDTGSESAIDISLPTSWSELSEAQLKMVYRLFAKDLTPEEVKTICVLRWNKMKVITKIGRLYWIKVGRRLVKMSARQIVNITATLNFLDELPPYPVRYKKYKGHAALSADFNGVPFQSYLAADNIFQGYLQTENMELLKTLVCILYDDDNINADKSACVMAFYWFASLKQMMARRFHHFYQPIDSVDGGNMLQAKSLHEKLTDAVNAQIRALTGGDVTKEPYIMNMDTLRALTELNAKAQEAEELKKRSK